ERGHKVNFQHAPIVGSRNGLSRSDKTDSRVVNQDVRSTPRSVNTTSKLLHNRFVSNVPRVADGLASSRLNRPNRLVGHTQIVDSQSVPPLRQYFGSPAADSLRC